MLEPLPSRRISGRFWRAIAVERENQVLDPTGPHSAGRYHRPGEPAFYMTSEADWAVIAIGRYLLADEIERVVVPLELDQAQMFDQHDKAACFALGVDRDASQVRWNDELAAGREPPSWRASGAARAAGYDGIIDRSRGIAGGWHACLFRWNAPNMPQVRVVGAAVACDYAASRARWPAPDGWELLTHLVGR